MKRYFEELSQAVFSAVGTDEQASLYFQGERSDFVRFNHARVRQIGTVDQAYAIFHLQKNNRTISEQFICGENAQEDARQLIRNFDSLREALEVLPEDPYAVFFDGSETRIEEDHGQNTSVHDVVQDICTTAAGTDLVGFYASGPQFFGYANHKGAYKWFSRASHVLEYSLYAHGDKAVKSGLAGSSWSADAWRNSFQNQKSQLALMERAPISLSPGTYRVFLSPAAIAEILDVFCWGGFSRRAKEKKRSALQLLYENKKALSPKISLAEDTEAGVGPFFNSAGFDRPAKTHLVQEGMGADLLVAPRTAKEIGGNNNGADEGESPLSLFMAGGQLQQEDVLAALGDGIYINNLWYLNYSDRLAGRITGMTRFGCFQVAGGRLVAPINVMRFDDSIYSLFGASCEGLTQQRQTEISAATYGARSASAKCTPGALLSAMKFTL